MKHNLVIDELTAAQGEKAKGFVVVDTTASGTLVRVPVILINGEERTAIKLLVEPR